MKNGPEVGWEATREAVLRGLNHALSNRVATLVGIARILEQNAERPDPILDALIGEVGRLESLFGLFSLLPAGSPLHLEPIELPGVLRAVAALHELRSDIDDPQLTLEAETSTRPIRVHRAGLVHALLRLTGATTAAAGEDAHIEMSCGSEDGRSWIRVRAVGTAGEDDRVGAEARAVADHVRALGGTMQRAGETTDSDWRLSFASL
jgi:nitrogen-specific signal transduction histidine kinase